MIQWSDVRSISYFNGAVVQTPPQGGGFPWREVWTGPGGELIVESVDRKAAIRYWDEGAGRVDHVETLTRPDGTAVQYVGVEGAEYQALPELMGEHWEVFRNMVNRNSHFIR